MHEIKTFTFEDHALTFERRADGEWWVNGDEAAEALGYEDKRKVANLFRRHADEFLPSETCVLTLKPQVGQARETRLYSPKGLEHLAMLGRTETCKRFRRWVLDVMEQLRGAARLVTEAQMEAALLTLAERVARETAARYDALLAQQGSSIAALARLGEVQASNAGRMLSLLARDPEVRRVIDAERDRRNGVNRLPFPDGDVAPSTN